MPMARPFIVMDSRKSAAASENQNQVTQTAPLAFIVLLGVLSAAGPLSTDMYLPSLPALSQTFNAGVGQTQLTLSSFLIGFALGQVISGPLADRFGRRPVLVVGFSLYAVASAASCFASTIETLIGLRFIQGAGASVGAAVTRAIVRDLYSAENAARVLSYMSTVMALLPAIAPLAGGALLGAFGWRANFVVMTVFGVMATLLTAAKLSETLRHPDPQAANPTQILSNFIRMLQHPQYLGCALAGACAFCGLFAFISGSSFVLIGVFGVSEQNFGFYFGAPVIGYMIGTQIGGRMTRNYGITTILSVGTACLALAGALIAALAIIRVDHPIAVVAPMAFYMIAVGLVLPQTLAGALTPFPDRAGTASSLLGFIQMSLGAVVGAMVAHLHDGTQVPMAAAIGVMGGLSFLMFQFVVKPAFRKTAA